MKTLSIEGEVCTGLNRGAGFLKLQIYNKIFKEELGGAPFCGTLNLKINPKHSDQIIEHLEQAREYVNLWHAGKKYGGILLLSANLKFSTKQQPCIIVRPKLTTHKIDTLELVAKISFRNIWGLIDADKVILEI